MRIAKPGASTSRARRRVGAAAVAFLASLLVLSPSVSQAAQVSIARIMPLGDSLTDGSDTVAGAYRISLERQLIAGKFDFNFVGSLTNGPSTLESQHHEGHRGYRIDEIMNGRPPNPGVTDWLTKAKPNDVLLMIGTNDIVQGYQLDAAPDRLSALIDEITTVSPSANVLVASIPPIDDPTLNALVQQYNAAIPGIVSQKQADGEHVSFVDVNAAVGLSDISPDGIHLNATGYAKVGNAWYQALTTILPARKAPPKSVTCSCTIWPSTTTPAIKQVTTATTPYELGVKFRSDVNGSITGIRFYKGPDNTGTHVGHLWTRTGNLLATVTFTNESATGWQQAIFDQPVPIVADTTYVASYYAPVGRFSKNNGFFNLKQSARYPLRGLEWGQSGPNGVYRSGSSGFPQTMSGQSNYWVDVVFSPATSAPAPATPGGVSASGVSASSIALSWNDVAGETGFRIERSPDGVTAWQAVGSVGAGVTTFSDTGLDASTTYFYRVFASNAAGDSAPSAVVSATTTA